MLHLTYEEIWDIHLTILEPTQLQKGDENRIRAILGTIQGGIDNQLYHPTALEAGAAYLYYFARAQAFNDGNKRTAVLAMATFLELNGKPLQAELGDEFVEAVAVGGVSKEDIILYLQTIT
jgi:death-on-curing protein